MTGKILIAGAGIAGITAAYWLQRSGFECTIVERAPDLRSQGQAVELSSPASKHIAKEMGITHEVLKQFGTMEAGLKFVREDDSVIWQNDMDPVNGWSITSDLEILRGDLANLLYESSKRQKVRYLFGDSVAAIEELGNSLEITFEKGHKEQYDFLIVCDGLYSKTRTVAGFANVEIRSMNEFFAFFTIENRVIGVQDKYARWYMGGGTKGLLLRPDSTGKNTRAYLSKAENLPGYYKLSQKEQKQLVRDRIQGGDYHINQVVSAMEDSTDFYLTQIAQVHCDKWSKGRVILCGDAAYCPSPKGGQGTDAALLGAYILARELADALKTGKDYRVALTRYEDVFRPFVKNAQHQTPKIINNILRPDTWWDVKYSRALLFVLGNTMNLVVGLLRVASRLTNFRLPDRGQFKLPEYIH